MISMGAGVLPYITQENTAMNIETPLATAELDTLIHKGQGRTITMEDRDMEDHTLNTTIEAEDSPTITEVPLSIKVSSALQKVQDYLLEAFKLTKAAVAPLATRGIPKYVMVVLFLLAANWLGNTIYEAIPASLGGIPILIGTSYLCPLVLRTNREKLAGAMREYLG